MGFAQKILPNYSYSDYVQWEGRWELIDGIPFAMSPLPVPLHQLAAGAIRSAFIVALKNAGCKKCHAYDPLDYKVAENTVVQPDILIVCREITKPFLDFAPVLVVEILSPATALQDRHTKFGIYESEGVKYYIIVDADKKLFEVYELKEGKYLRRDIPSNEPFNFSFDQDCNVNVLLNAIWED